MSLLIQNGLIYDGKGRPPFNSDIAVRGKYVVGLDNYKKEEFDVVIDAQGSIVTPGLIDPNSSSDHHLYLLSDHLQGKFLENGVTTIIGGTQGKSLAPLYHDYFMGEWGYAVDRRFNINWHSFAEMLASIKARGVGVNFGSLVGLSTLRAGIAMQGHDQELDTTFKELQKALDAGALGLSIGSETILSNMATHENKEFKLKILTRMIENQLCHSLSVDFSEIREDGTEIVEIAMNRGVNLHISDVQPVEADAQTLESLFDKLDLSSENISVLCDSHSYTARKVPISRFLPSKIYDNKKPDEILDAVLEHKDEIISYYSSNIEHDVRIVHVPDDVHFWRDKTIKEIAKSRNIEESEALYEVIKLTKLRALCVYEDVAPKLLEDVLFSRHSSVGSDGIHLESDQYKQPFPRFFKKAEKRQNYPLEQAVAKMTSKPAKYYNLQNRGEILVDNFADIVVWKNFQPSEVIVNGEIVVKNGQHKNKLEGMVLQS